MPDGRVVWVEIGAGAVRTGLWCPTCLTPAGYEVGVGLLGEDGVTQLDPVRGCARCEGVEP